MSDFTLLDLALPYQKQFILARKRKKLWLASRQVGKSWTLSYLSVYNALSKRNGLSLCVSTGARAAGEIVKKCTQFAEAVKTLTDKRIDYVASADQIRFSTGSRVLSLPSGNPDTLRGWTSDCTVIDECAFLERPDQVMQAIAPTLTRNKDAEFIVASTPAGRSGLFYDLYSSADDTWYIQTTTIEDAVAGGLKLDLKQIHELCPDQDVFEQEYMCRFASEYSQLVDLSLLEFYEDPPEDVKTRYLGVDIGSVSDRTALVTLLSHSGTLYVDDIAVMHKASYESQLAAMRDLHSRNRYAAGYIDANGIGSAVAEFASKQISAKIKGFTWTGANKTPAYESLRASIFDRKVKFNKKFEALIRKDFANVHRIVSETGKVTFEAGRDSNGHSDVTSAVVLALQAAKDNPASMTMPSTWARPTHFGARSSFF